MYIQTDCDKETKKEARSVGTNGNHSKEVTYTLKRPEKPIHLSTINLKYQIVRVFATQQSYTQQ